MASVGSENGDVVSLNIMPLLDIFSILILFLLMSFSTDPVSHDINGAVDLPDSDTLRSLDEVPTIILTRKEIFVNDKKISTLINGDVPKRQGAQGAIFPLFVELEKLSKANKRMTKKKSDVLTVESDKGHKYALLKKVMLSAQQADFTVFKMMVAKRSD